MWNHMSSTGAHPTEALERVQRARAQVRSNSSPCATTSMFAFVPRKVAKSLRSSGVSSKSSKNDSKDPATSSAAAPVTLPLRSSESSSKGKGKETQATLVAEEDYAALVLLSLTEYALWADPDLRMSVESSEEGCACRPYTPISERR